MVRFATGTSLTAQKRAMGLRFMLNGEKYDSNFIKRDLNDNFDGYLHLPWLRRYEP